MMRDESIGWRIARIILMSLFVFFMGMIYWSSTLIEQDVKSLRQEMFQIKNEIQSININPGITSQVTNNPDSSSHIDPLLPNLLTEDPFYTTYLPSSLGKNFKPEGIYKLASIGKPEHLHPFSPWYEVNNWIGLCSISIGQEHFGIYETYAPALAKKMELRFDHNGEPEYWIHLRQDVFWEPLKVSNFSDSMTLSPQFFQRTPVTSRDVKFYFDAIMNPHVQEPLAIAMRLNFQDIKELRIIDNYTLVVKWKIKEFLDEKGEIIRNQKYKSKLLTVGLKPLASFVYQYFADGTKIISDDSDPNAYRTSAIWAQNFSHHWAKNIIVSNGAWTFDGMTDREIRFKRNTRFYGRYDALMAQREVSFKNSWDAVWESFKAGLIDSFEMPPHQLYELDHFLQSDHYKEQAAKGLGINKLDYYMRAFTYIGWNQTRPFFKSNKVRQALTMAIDRQRIIAQNLNGMGAAISGPFFIYSPSYDKSIQPFPYDIYKARQLLQEEGWFDSDGDGIIDKVIDGKSTPFQFTLTYYVKNISSKAICEYVATALKEMGIVCNLNGVDVADLSAATDEKSFDALFLAWVLDSPPEDPKQLWYSTGAKEKGSSNFVGFSNQEADSIIDELEYEDNLEKRIALYHRFHAILHEEQPYTFLYTPKNAFVYRKYLQNVFLPADRQDIVPGANVAEPQPNIFWIKSEDAQISHEPQ